MTEQTPPTTTPTDLHMLTQEQLLAAVTSALHC